MSQIETISTGYQPRKIQSEIHRKLKRFNVLVLHRRAGKTVLCVNEVLDKALRNPRKNPQYAYLAPYFGQAKRIAWQYFKDYTDKIPGVKYNEAELRVNIPRPHNDDTIRIYLLGAENPSALRGIYLDGVVLDEYAVMDPTIWGEVIRPTLSDRQGWAIFIGTPHGQNHFWELFEKAKCTVGWWAKLFSVDDTGILPQDEIEAAKAEMTKEQFDQEFLCKFEAAIKGAYYSKQIEELEKKGRISESVQHDTALPVYTFWDLGMNDTTVVCFVQVLNQEIRFIDYIENRGQPLSYYAQLVNDRPYNYGLHELPWDAAARSYETGNTREQILARLLRGPVTVQKRNHINDGIDAVRRMLPKCWFNATNCEPLIKALKSYSQKWDPKRQVFDDKPLHNWASNPADCVRYAAMGLRQQQIDHSSLPRMAINDYSVYEV